MKKILEFLFKLFQKSFTENDNNIIVQEIEQVNTETICVQEEKVNNKMGNFNRLSSPKVLSKTGVTRLSQCCKEIQDIINEVLWYRDISITCGYRSNEEQEEMCKKGTSKAHAGQSAHNFKPSLAIDIVPYPIPMKNNEWDNDSKEWEELADLMFDIAKSKGVSLEWGGNWKSLRDCPHYEIKNWKNLV